MCLFMLKECTGEKLHSYSHSCANWMFCVQDHFSEANWCTHVIDGECLQLQEELKLLVLSTLSFDHRLFKDGFVLQEFRNSLRPATAQGRLERQSALSKTSLNSSINSANTTPKTTPSEGRRPPPAAFTVSHESHRRPAPRTTPASSMYNDNDVSFLFGRVERSGLCESPCRLRPCHRRHPSQLLLFSSMDGRDAPMRP